MELLGLLGVVLFAVLVATPIVAFVALRRTGSQSEEIRSLRAEIVTLRRWIRSIAEEEGPAVGEGPGPAAGTHAGHRPTTSGRVRPDPVVASRTEAPARHGGDAAGAQPPPDHAGVPSEAAAGRAGEGRGGGTAGGETATDGAPGPEPVGADTAGPEQEVAGVAEPDAAGAHHPASDAPGSETAGAGTAGTARAPDDPRRGGVGATGRAETAGAHAGTGASADTGRSAPGKGWTRSGRSGGADGGADGESDDAAAAARTAIDFETLIGSTWLLRIGLGVLAIALALFARSILPQLSPAAKVALAYAGAMGLFATGRVFEKSLEKFARPVMAAGLTFGFFVAFAAHFVPAMSTVTLPISIVWMVVSMGAVLVAAETWRSQTTAALAIILGHISAFVSASDAAIYSLVMIAFLALTAAMLMIRHGWMVVGLLAIAASYGSHLLWLLVERDPIPGDLGFWLNLAFLTSYYTIFLIGDVLWWRRDRDRDEGDVTADQVRSARQTGPANLVLYASLTSYVYLITGARVETIEWFYLTLGTVQGALAWYYWRIEHRDFVFYPAFGTVLWTLGWFAALDALALNLVLAAQALLLLLAAHHTRLLVFHALAQLALVVAFVHYLVYPTPPGSTLGLFIGGLGIAGVYLLKASLEEVWYGDPDGELAAFDEAEPRVLERTLREAFRAVAPYLASIHAALGGFVLVRELIQHLGPELRTVLALVAAQALLTALVLFRKRGALLFACTVVAASSVYVAAESVDPVATVSFLAGLMLVALALVHLLDAPEYERVELGPVQAQAAAGFVFLATAVAIDTLDLAFAMYLPAMLVPVLLFVFQERVLSGGYATDSEPLSRPTTPVVWVSWGMCIGAALLIHGLTVEGVGLVASAPLWLAGWAVVLGVAAYGRRSVQLFLAGYTLLAWGYLDLVTRSSTVWPGAMDAIWIGALVTVVPLAYALAMDRGLDGLERAEKPIPQAGGPMTYFMYALGLFLVAAFAGSHLAAGWSLVTSALFGLALMLVAPGLRAERAGPSAVAAFFALHYLAAGLTLGSGGNQVSLVAILLFSVVTLACERQMLGRAPSERSEAAWGYAGVGLVVLAAWTGMLAIYMSDEFGPQWATAGWSVLGVLLMGAGFGLRASTHRRVALLVLAVCLVRVFAVDTQGLSDTARTGVFFVLGLCLVGVAWLYSRFSTQLKSWL